MSSVSLSTIAVLENPRQIPKTKTIVFDAQVYLGSSEPALLMSLHYYNADNMEFNDVICCKADIHPARTSPTVEVYSQELTPVDYHAFGDIIHLAPLGSPESFDLCHRPVVHACGPASSIDKQDSTFEINAEQYLSVNKQTDNVFPIRCLFPATPRWEKYKPIPSKGKPVAVEGVLTGVERNEDRMVKHFIVDMEKVTFLGQAPTAPKAETSPAKPNNNSTRGTAAHLKFTGFFGSQESAKSGERPAKKRKTVDDRALEESEVQDKGEGSSTGRRAGRN
ncbi:hypothetical protein C8J57DRAFT_1246187 [Mycena rebaudengoi]|nr:hypothetical protein C8J57DRAFT_1246187 [Mycena rebaudengoi]